MSSVENRIVSIKFDNQQFEQNVAQTLSSLDKLSGKLQSVGAGAGQGFGDINKAAQNVNLDTISSGVDKIASKFDALGAIGFSAINDITSSVLNFAKTTGAQDILGPILTGGKQRAEDLQQAEFSFNAFGINVAEVMKDANTAVLGTAFSLSDAAKAAGELAAAGVGAGDQMTSTLRAIAGVAAVTGDSFTDMATIFTQSAAAGTVNNQDLLQLSTRGLNAAAAIATQLGTTQEAVHAMATNGTLDFNTFASALDKAFGQHATEANQTYTGALDNLHAALARVGAAFISPELDQKRDLFNTLSPVLGQVAKALAPIEFTILGIRKSLNDDLISKINAFAFLKLPEITEFVSPNIATGLDNIFNLVKQLGDALKTAFHDIFPGDFTTTLVLISDRFVEITNAVKIGGPALDKVTNIFKGLFSILDILWAVIKGVALVLGDLFKALDPAGAGLLQLGSNAGTFLQNMDQVLVKGGAIHDFFEKLGTIIQVPVKLIGELAAKITEFFQTGFGNVAIGALFDRIGARVTATEDDVKSAESVWDRFKAALQGVFHILDEVGDAIKQWFHELGHKIAQAMQPADFNSALDAVNVGLLGAITVMLKKFFAGGVKFGFGGGVFNSVKSSLRNLTQSLKLMQTNLKADALLKIAGAIAVIAASVVALSLINSADLTKALAAMTVGFGQLAGMILILDKSVLSIGGAAKIDLLAAALIELGIAMVIFAGAIAILGHLSLNELAKGLTGVAIGMGIMVEAVNAIDANTEGMISAGIAIGIIAVAMRILADAVKAFGSLDFAQLAKGLGSVAISMTILVTSLNALDGDTSGFVKAGISMGIIAVSLRILADAVKAFSGLSLKQLAKGLGSVAVSMVILVTSLNGLEAEEGGLISAGIAIGLIAVGLRLLANVLKVMGAVPFGTMAKAIGELAVVMLILVVALNGMEEALPGAAALVIIAASLEILADVFKKLGQLSIAQLGTALGAIVAFLLVIGTLSVLGSEAIPFIAALGAALLLLGAGFALVGVGAFLTITALALLIKVVETTTESIPKLAAAAADLVTNFINDVLIGLPTIIKTLTAVIDTLLDTIVKEFPKLTKALGLIIDNLVKLIQSRFPELVQLGAQMVIQLLNGLGNNAKAFVDAATKLVSNFAQAVEDNAGQLATAAVNMIQAFIEVIDAAQTEIVIAAASLIVSLINGISQGVGLILAAAANLITTFITELGNHVGDIITAGANMLINLLIGITNNLVDIVVVVGQMIITFITALENEELTVIAAGVNLVIAFMFGIAQQALKLVDAAGACILSFINGLTAAVNKYEPAIIIATIGLGFAIIGGIFTGITNAPAIKDISGWLFDLGSKVVGWVKDIGGFVKQIGSDIVHGIWQGISDSTSWFGTQLRNWAHNALSFLTHPWEIFSPSKATARMGVQLVRGVIVGLDSETGNLKTTMNGLANNMLNAFNPDPKDLTTTFGAAVAQLNGLDEFNPKITPVLDLSKVKAAAGGITDALGVSTIAPTVSTVNASGISKDLLESAAAALDAAKAAPAEPGDVIFNQTNNSPKALSTDDLYRNTRSQLTLAKEELSIP